MPCKAKTRIQESKPKRRQYKVIPCRKCLSLPICIATFKQSTLCLSKDKMSKTAMYQLRSYLFLKSLIERCSLIIDYVYELNPIDTPTRTYVKNASPQCNGKKKNIGNISVQRMTKLRDYFYDITGY